jgi:hypothetical protein
MKFKMPYNTQTVTSSQENQTATVNANLSIELPQELWIQVVSNITPKNNACLLVGVGLSKHPLVRALFASSNGQYHYACPTAERLQAVPCRNSMCRDRVVSRTDRGQFVCPKHDLPKCCPRLSRVWMDMERVTAASAEKAKNAYERGYSARWGVQSSEVEEMYLQDQETAVSGEREYLRYRNLQVWTSEDMYLGGLFQEKSVSRTADVQPSSLKGFNIKKKMPTKVEVRGVEWAEHNPQTVMEAGLVAPVASRLNLFREIDYNIIPRGDQNPFGQTLLPNVPFTKISLTNSVLRDVPDINFQDDFAKQRPVVGPQSLNVVWGYSMTKLPPSGKGPLYNDLYAVTTWAKNSTAQPASIHKYPVVSTKLNYQTAATQQVVLGRTVAQSDTSVPDLQQFISQMDKLKQLPADFLKARDVKAASGDNHVALLATSTARLLALKQAVEGGAKLKIVKPAQQIKDSYLDVSEKANPRATTSSGIANQLASVMTSLDYRGGMELIIPSESASAEELITLGYLAGIFDDVLQWTLDGKRMEAMPYFATVRSEASRTFKIPACNAMRLYNLSDLADAEFSITLGKCEMVLNSYIRRMGIEGQVVPAMQLLAAVAVSGTSEEHSGTLGGFPLPRHATDYDLWASTRGYRDLVLPSLIREEQANLLAAMFQTKASVLLNITVAKLVEHLEEIKVPMASNFGAEEVDKWITSNLGGNKRSPWYNYVTDIVPGQNFELLTLMSGSRYDMKMSISRHILSRIVLPSALLFHGESVTKGSLGLIWDEARRKKEIEQSTNNPKNSKILAFLYSGKEDVFDTTAPAWAGLVVSSPKGRVMRKYSVATGVRSQRRVVGPPRIVYIGLHRDAAAHNSRFADVVDNVDMGNHYEATFDMTSAAMEVANTVPLRYYPTDAGRHETEPIKPQPKRETTYKDILQRGMDAIPDKTKKDLFRQGLKWLGDTGKKTSGPSTLEEAQKLDPSHSWNEKIARQYIKPKYDVKLNGLAEAMEQRIKNTEKRLSDAHHAMRNPEPDKGTEIVELTAHDANGVAFKTFKDKGFKCQERFADAEISHYALLHVIEEQVVGDGRCGARAVHHSLVEAGVKVSLKEVYAVEAEILGMSTQKAPLHIWVSDQVLALIAAKFGFDLLIFFQEGRNEDEVTSIRMLAKDDQQNRPFITLIGLQKHWNPASMDEELDSSTLSEFEDKFVAGVIAMFGPKPPQPSTKKGAGPSRSQKKREARKISRSAEALSDQAFQQIVEQSEEYNFEQRARLDGPVADAISDLLKMDRDWKLVGEKEVSSTGSSGLGEHLPHRLQSKIETYLKDRGYQVGPGIDKVSHEKFNLEPFVPTSSGTHLYLFQTMGDYIALIEDPERRARSQAVLSELLGSPEDEKLVYACRPNHALMMLFALAGDECTIIAEALNARDGLWMEMIRTTTIETPRVEVSQVYQLLLIVDRTVYEVRGGNWGSRDAFKNIMRDSSNASHRAKMLIVANNGTLHYGEKSREQWIDEVRGKLTAMGVIENTATIKCDQHLSDIFEIIDDPKNGAEVDGPQNNIDRMVSGLMSLGLPIEASWMKYSSLKWLESIMGWLPTDPQWYGEETAKLLLCAKGLRVWSFQDGETNHTITQTTLPGSRRTVPLAFTVVDGEVIMTKESLTLPVFENFAVLQDYCDTHRKNGTMPKPPISGPHNTTLEREVAARYLKKEQWWLLGIVSSVALTAVAYTAYRKRYALGRVYHTANAALRRDGRDALRQPLLSQMNQVVENVDYEQNGYGITKFFRNLKKRVMPLAASTYQEADTRSLVTVDLGPNAAQGSDVVGIEELRWDDGWQRELSDWSSTHHEDSL